MAEHTPENCEKLAQLVVDSMDIGDLLTYCVEQFTINFKEDINLFNEDCELFNFDEEKG
jgi:hypothetical protein